MDKFQQLLKALVSKAATSTRGVGTAGMAALPAVGALAILGVGSIGVYNSIVTVRPGQLGIIYNRIGGINETALCKEGMNFIIPWFQRPIIYDVRTRPQLINTQTGSKDLQMIQISLRVLYRPNQNHLPFIYRRLGKDFDERVLPSIVNEVAKAIVAQYNASELLTKREIVSQQIREMLSARAAHFKIILDDVSVTHLTFSTQYTAAVEAKQVAQQDAERSKYVVEKAIQEKSQIVIKAEGEAKSAELIGAAIRDNPAFLQLRRIEASKEVAHVIASSPGNKVYLNADSLLVNYLGNVPSETSAKKSGSWW